MICVGYIYLLNIDMGYDGVHLGGDDGMWIMEKFILYRNINFWHWIIVFNFMDVL